MHVKKGDKVSVISGIDRVKQGTIQEAYPKNDRVLVEGINMINKHAKSSQENLQGRILNQEAAHHVPNVMPIDPISGAQTRVGYKEIDGKILGISKKSVVSLEKFNQDISPALVEKFNYKSVMEVPRVEKIIINMGVGDAVQNSKVLDNAVEELSLITGQRPVVTYAKKSISGFRLREGMPIGTK